MTSDRFVLLGLARPRAGWFSEISRWATSAIVPAEFVKCVSAEELRARLAAGRPWSAALLDGTLTVVDRDLLSAVRDAGCAPIVVDDRDGAGRWRAIGAAAVLPTSFDRAALLEVLESCATSVLRPTGLPGGEDDARDRAGRRATVYAVCGPGGTGASTVAAGLAQGLVPDSGSTLLADLARNAEQAVLHDVRDVAPGIQELVEAHRNGVPSVDEVRSLTFSVVERGYALLLGLRRARYWPSLRPRAFASAFESLRQSFDVVVCDVSADFEGEVDAGSRDVEERNLAARTAVLEADVVLAVGRPGVKGMHALVRVLGDLAGAGVSSSRMLPVITCAPRSPRARAELVGALGELAAPVLSGSTPAPPLFLPNRSIESAVRDGAPIPSPLPAKLAAAAQLVLERSGPLRRVVPEPVAVAPGSLGSFVEGEW